MSKRLEELGEKRFEAQKISNEETQKIRTQFHEKVKELETKRKEITNALNTALRDFDKQRNDLYNEESNVMTKTESYKKYIELDNEYFKIKNLIEERDVMQKELFIKMASRKEEQTQVVYASCLNDANLYIKNKYNEDIE